MHDLKFDRLRLAPAYRMVADELLRKIGIGDIKVGDALPSEAQLAQAFGVNRSTVREGIRQLESEGLLRRTGKRLLVSSPDHADIAPRVARSMVLGQVTFRELWSVALALEPLSAALAAQNATDEQIATLFQTVEQAKTVMDEPQTFSELDTEFHTLLCQAAGNRVLLLSRDPVGRLLHPTFRRVLPLLPQAPARLIEAHRQVLDGVRRRDGDHAELWMRRHVNDFRRAYEMTSSDLDAPVELET